MWGQEVHGAPSSIAWISSSAMRSKSSGTLDCPAMKPSRRRAADGATLQWQQLRDGLACPGNNESLASFRGLLKQARQVSLRFAEADDLHGGFHRLDQIRPV